jgi:hypothetical protein
VITIDELVSSSKKPGNRSLGLRPVGGTRLTFVPGTFTSFDCANDAERAFANEQGRSSKTGKTKERIFTANLRIK